MHQAPHSTRRSRHTTATWRDWIWFFFPSVWWDRYPSWLQRVTPPIYVAFLILLGIGVLIAIVVGFVALTDPAALNH